MIHLYESFHIRVSMLYYYYKFKTRTEQTGANTFRPAELCRTSLYFQRVTRAHARERAHSQTYFKIFRDTLKEP